MLNGIALDGRSVAHHALLMRVTPIRTDRLQLLVTQEERDMAVAIARARGRTLSDVLRDLLRREHAALAPHGEPRPTL